MSPENTKRNAFILQPFCMEARMEKNASKFPLKSLPLIPRFKVILLFLLNLKLMKTFAV